MIVPAAFRSASHAALSSLRDTATPTHRGNSKIATSGRWQVSLPGNVSTDPGASLVIDLTKN
jgi:hypothetical protein